MHQTIGYVMRPCRERERRRRPDRGRQRRAVGHEEPWITVNFTHMIDDATVRIRAETGTARRMNRDRFLHHPGFLTALDPQLAGANIILAGHTHLPFSHTFKNRLVANPGSLGQSKAGDSRARYAIWQDGQIELKACEYPVEKTVAKVLDLPVPDEVKHDLVHVLRTGTAP
jgi:hypothetical protein